MRYRADAPKTQEVPQKTKAHYRATVEQRITTLPWRKVTDKSTQNIRSDKCT